MCFSGELSTVIKMLGTEVFKFEVLFIVSLCEVSMLRSKSLVFLLPGHWQSLRIAMLRYLLGRPADFHADIFFQLFLLPHKMCLHHPGGFLNYILCTVLHSIQSFLWFFAMRTKSPPRSCYTHHDLYSTKQNSYLRKEVKTLKNFVKESSSATVAICCMLISLFKYRLPCRCDVGIWKKIHNPIKQSLQPPC